MTSLDAGGFNQPVVIDNVCTLSLPEQALFGSFHASVTRRAPCCRALRPSRSASQEEMLRNLSSRPSTTEIRVLLLELKPLCVAVSGGRSTSRSWLRAQMRCVLRRRVSACSPRVLQDLFVGDRAKELRGKLACAPAA